MIFGRKKKEKEGMGKFEPVPKIENNNNNVDLEPIEVQPQTPASQPMRQQEKGSAPLFVKVDKYKEILEHVKRVKNFAAALKEINIILDEIEIVRKEATKVLNSTSQKIERALAEMDTNLLRPHGLEVYEEKQEEMEMENIRTSLTDLEKNLGKLRKELDTLK